MLVLFVVVYILLTPHRRLATGTYSDQCIIWDVNGGSHEVVHIGREKLSSSTTILQNNDYSTRPKRRKFTEDMDMFNEINQEFCGDGIMGSSSQNILVQALGNTWTKSFSGEMKSEYMIDDNQVLQHNSLSKHSNGHSHISFAKKTSVLAADASHDVFALVASGQLYVYDIKR